MQSNRIVLILLLQTGYGEIFSCNLSTEIWNIYTKKCVPNNWRTHTKIYFLYFLTAAILCFFSFAFSFNTDLQGHYCVFNYLFFVMLPIWLSFFVGIFFFFFHFCHHISVSLSHTHTHTHSLHYLIFTILFYTWDYFNNCLVDGYIPSHNFNVFCATATSTAINLSLLLFYLIIHVHWSSANSYFIARLLMLSEQIIFWIFMSE